MGSIIAVSSTHGTGKTTCAYNLAASMKKAGYNVIVLDEVARSCPFEINQGAGPKTERWLLATQLKLELELIQNFDYVITDRSLLDPLSYAYVLAKADTSFKDRALFSTGFIAFLVEHINENYLTTLLLDKDSFNYQVDDGVRDLDPKFRANVYTALHSFTVKAGVTHKIIYKTKDIYQELQSYGINVPGFDIEESYGHKCNCTVSKRDAGNQIHSYSDKKSLVL